MSYLTDHAEDLFGRAEYEVTSTAFLTPAEQREIFDALPAARERLVFWGGALEAERRCAFFIPDWMIESFCVSDPVLPAEDPVSPRSAEVRSLSSLGAFSRRRERTAAMLDAEGALSGGKIAVVHMEGSGFAAPGHRDFMGAILNLGIRRETLGDIVLLGEGVCDAYCTEAAAQVMEQELRRIGRDTVKVSVRPVAPGEKIERQYEELTVIVASLRLDCIVGEIASASRETAKRLIASGAVAVDHRENTNADARVGSGATLSVRGVGKFRLGEALGETRKGRIRVKVYKYV